MRLNGKKANDLAAQTAIEAELDRLDIMDWPESMTRLLPHFMKRTEVDGKIQVASTTSRRTFWARHKDVFPYIATGAIALLSAHVTTAAAERNWSAWGRIYTNIRNRLGLLTAEMMVYIKANIGDHGGDDDLSYVVALT